MSEADIAEVKARFINTALLAQRVGFDGCRSTPRTAIC